jgi:hypothetical protein
LGFSKAAKFALINLLIPFEVSHVLIIDPAVVLRGDIAIVQTLGLTGAVCVAPVMSSSRSKLWYWNTDEFVQQRFNRPFHTTAIVWIDLKQWRAAHAGDVSRKIYANQYPFQKRATVDDDLFNQLQLDVQVATLPEGTLFCARYNARHFAEKAFAHLLCAQDSIDLIGSDYNHISVMALTED